MAHKLIKSQYGYTRISLKFEFFNDNSKKASNMLILIQ